MPVASRARRRRAADASWLSVDWGNPVSEDPLNRDLGLWLMAVPNRRRGTAWVDLTSFQRHGTLTSMAAPATATSGWQEWAAGMKGAWANVAFDGTNDHVVLPSGLFSASTTLSISLWFQLSNLTTYRTLWSGYTNDNNSMEILFIPSGDAPSVGISGGNYNASAKTADNAVAASTWYHAALTSDGATTRIYLDGAAGPTTGTTNFNSRSGASYVGIRAGTDFPTIGFVNSVRAYPGRCLSDEEVLALYRDECAFCPRTLRRRGPRVAKAPAAGGGGFQAACARRHYQLMQTR